VKNPLNLPLSSFKQGENKLSFKLQPRDLELRTREVAENPSFEFFVGPVNVALAITRTGLRLLVTGSVSYRARLECAICGGEYECDFDEPLAAEFLSCDEEPEKPGRKPECEDEGGLHGNWLDLLPLPARLPGAVPGVRHGLEQGAVRVRSGPVAPAFKLTSLRSLPY
jgi:uncharacterized metal-binding protein YceD (DUF177 family)